MVGGYGLKVIKSKLGRRPKKKKKGDRKGSSEKEIETGPPYLRTGKLKNSIVYRVDPAGESVYIGPLSRSGSKGPDLLEFGGTGKALLPDGKKVIGKYEPRPYLEPCQDIINQKFLEFSEREKL